ncbi:hypothetical protein GT352_25815 [Streptomyces sp. SID1046]|uniref:hypothetical protein n=1 Tax=Streptomyces sp. SID1046 TaxID=2690249 RepID=UPI00136ED1F4|nr:hypothetical protein [Streptomyces sp. SID1046]MYV77319.1 hypothetical protein [Streptomyces sp. SID1046]
MSITSRIPVLHAGKETVALVEDDALLVRRPHEQTHIPLKAISRVRAQGQSVTIELTAAPTTDMTHVHRVWDVVDADGVAFAAAVNAALPERTEETEAIDGADLVSGERLYQPSYRNWLRGMKRGALVATLVAIGACVLVGSTGSPAAMIFIIPFSFFAIPVLAFGAFLAYAPVEERYLRKHGVRTAAVRLQDQPGLYAYADPGGVVRTVRHSIPTWSIEAAYDPRDPGRVLPLRSRGRRIRDAVLVAFILGVGLLCAGGAVAAVVGAFLGQFDSMT